MKKQQTCRHKLGRSRSIQRLGTQPPLELRQCTICHSTVSTWADAGASPRPVVVLR